MALPPGANGLAVTGKEINTARETCKAGLRDFAQFVDLGGARPGCAAGCEANIAKRLRAHVAAKIPLPGLLRSILFSQRRSASFNFSQNESSFSSVLSARERSSGSSSARLPACLAKLIQNLAEGST
jgi:hypothetical protein